MIYLVLNFKIHLSHIHDIDNIELLTIEVYWLSIYLPMSLKTT